MRLVVEPAAVSARRRVLEVGGTGGLAHRVAAELGGELVAAGAFEELPFAAASFDVVVASPDRSDAGLAELRRLLREDGQLLALAPQSQWFMLRHFTVVERRQDLFVCIP